MSAGRDDEPAAAVPHELPPPPKGPGLGVAAIVVGVLLIAIVVVGLLLIALDVGTPELRP